MNYYPHHVGDYLKDTAHLSLIEHGAYRRLLDVYYTREKPFSSVKEACDYVLVRSSAEKRAVENVLKNPCFFEELDGVFYNNRAELEIKRWKEKSNKASASAEARWGCERIAMAMLGPDAMAMLP